MAVEARLKLGPHACVSTRLGSRDLRGASGARLARYLQFKASTGSAPMTATVIRVKVKPNARTSALNQMPDGSWVAQVRAPAIEGRANKELIALVAEHFQCMKAAVSIKSGAAGRLKLIRIEAG